MTDAPLDSAAKADPDVTLILPLSAAINLESELLARFSASYFTRSLGLRRAGVAMASMALGLLALLIVVFYLAHQLAFAGQMVVLFFLAAPATLEKHLELSRLVRARREILKRRGVTETPRRFPFLPSRLLTKG